MNLNFLTWNIKNNKSKDFFEDLYKHLITERIDILILQECFYDEPFEKSPKFEEIKDILDQKGTRWVRIFKNKDAKFDYSAQTFYLNNKMNCIEIIPESGIRFNLIGVHLYSQTSKSKEMQNFQNEDIPKFIKEFEEKQENGNSIILGDLNYRPFDKDLIHPSFLNTSNNRAIIKHFEKRDIGSRSFDFFYDPMWNLLGDYDYLSKSDRINGTYYWYPDDVEKYHWNIIDGVLLRPSIMDNLLINTLKIVTLLNDKPLVKNKPSELMESFLEDGFSDHLPISFTLNID